MQAAVDGVIDIIGLDNDVCILLNDEGKLIGLEGNRSLGNDIIVGDFYICGSDDEGNLTSLTDKLMEQYKEEFYEPETFTAEEIENSSGVEIYFF